MTPLWTAGATLVPYLATTRPLARGRLRALLSLVWACWALGISEGVVPLSSHFGTCVLTGMLYETFVWPLKRSHVVHHVVTAALLAFGLWGHATDRLTPAYSRLVHVSHWVHVTNVLSVLRAEDRRWSPWYYWSYVAVKPLVWTVYWWRWAPLSPAEERSATDEAFHVALQVIFLVQVYFVALIVPRLRVNG